MSEKRTLRVVMDESAIRELVDRAGLKGWALSADCLNKRDEWGQLIDPGSGGRFDRAFYDDFDLHCVERAKRYMAIWKRPSPTSKVYVSAGGLKVYAERCGYLTNGDSVLAALLLGLKVKAPEGVTKDGWGRGHASVCLPKAATSWRRGYGDYTKLTRWTNPGAVAAYLRWAEEEEGRNRSRIWVRGDVLRLSEPFIARRAAGEEL